MKQSRNSPFMQLPSQDSTQFNGENAKRKLDLNAKSNLNSPIIEVKIPDALAEICFSKPFFRNGLALFIRHVQNRLIGVSVKRFFGSRKTRTVAEPKVNRLTENFGSSKIRTITELKRSVNQFFDLVNLLFGSITG